jgi:hypothetical protein
MNAKIQSPKSKARPGRNLDPVPLAEVVLDPADPRAYLLALREFVDERAGDAIRWYLYHKVSVSRWSKWMRLMAIAIATLGTLMPLIGSTPVLSWLGTEATGNYGYGLLALAGAMILGDKLFGLSSRWMRYMTTAMALQRHQAEFEMDWAALWLDIGDQQPSSEQQAQVLRLLRNFRLAIVTEVEEETRIWVAEFESGLAQLERLAQEGPRATPLDAATKPEIKTK